MLLFWQRKSRWRPKKSPAQLWQKFKHRFKRPAPLLYLALVVMALVAGVLYVPQNIDTEASIGFLVWQLAGRGALALDPHVDFRMNVARLQF